jgi:hypothetical protein
MIKRGQLLGRSLFRIQDRRDQPVQRFGVRYAVEPIVDHPHNNAVALVAAVGSRGVDPAEVRTVGQPPVDIQARILADPPQ